MKHDLFNTTRFRAAILALEKTLEREGINKRTAPSATKKRIRAEYLDAAKFVAGVKPKKDETQP